MRSDSNETEPAESEPPEAVNAPTVGSTVAFTVDALAENPSAAEKPEPEAVAVMFPVAVNETAPPPFAVTPA